MPRNLISDAHEWINEIPTVPIYQQRSHSFGNRQSLINGERRPCSISGRNLDLEEVGQVLSSIEVEPSSYCCSNS